MILKMWKQECGPYNLVYNKPENFILCHWQKNDEIVVGWFAYRTVMAALFISGFIYSILPQTQPTMEHLEKYYIFLTNWTFSLETILFVWGFSTTLYAFLTKNCEINPLKCMSWYLKTYWIFYNVVLSSSVIVTVTFFSAVYNPVTGPLHFGGMIVHIFNSAFMVIDFFLIAFPIRGMHFYIPLSYGLTYCIFTIVYQLSGGTGLEDTPYIYKIVNWKAPLSAGLTTLLILLFLIVIHCTFSILHIFKVWVKQKEYKTSNV